MYDQHIIVDFEMNPVSKKNGEVRVHLRKEIIEIGAVKLDSHNRIIDRFSCLVKPQYNEDIVYFITSLTGIKTSNVKKAYNFESALSEFSNWIGDGKTRMYSWSDTDLQQLREECTYKNVVFPKNMSRWVDFQVLYPRVMNLNKSKKMSLSEATQWYGISIDKKKVHRALYDAEITAELVIPVLSGEYKKQVRLLNAYRDNDYSSSFTLGDACNDVFRKFMSVSSNEIQFAR